MTKDQFINLIKTQKDEGLLTAIYYAVLETLPSGYAHNLMYESFVDNIYDGDVYVLTHIKTGNVFKLAGLADTHAFFKSYHPKYSKDMVFRARDKKISVYGYHITVIKKGLYN